MPYYYTALDEKLLSFHNEREQQAAGSRNSEVASVKEHWNIELFFEQRPQCTEHANRRYFIADAMCVRERTRVRARATERAEHTRARVRAGGRESRSVCMCV